MKESLIGPTDKTGLVAIVDTGYTRICFVCSTRWGNVPFFKGRPREVKLEACEPCATKPGGMDSFRLRDRTRKRR
jgi:hypothetical protein